MRLDATAKTHDLSFGRSEKSAFCNFSVVTLQVATLEIAECVFFRNRDKILRRSFGSRVRLVFFSDAAAASVRLPLQSMTLPKVEPCLLDAPKSLHSVNFRWLPSGSHTQICQTHLFSESFQNSLPDFWQCHLQSSIFKKIPDFFIFPIDFFRKISYN